MKNHFQKKVRENNTKEIKWKKYIDSEGYTYIYSTIEMLCGLITCMECPNYSKCSKNNEFDSCYEYNEKLKELKKEGIK